MGRDSKLNPQYDPTRVPTFWLTQEKIKRPKIWPKQNKKTWIKKTELTQHIMIILGYHNISFFLTLSLRIYIIQAGLSQVISGWIQIQTRPNSSQVFVYLSK